MKINKLTESKKIKESANEKSIESFLTKFGFNDERYPHIINSYNDNEENVVSVSFDDGITAKDYRILKKNLKDSGASDVYLGKKHIDSSEDNELWLTVNFEFMNKKNEDYSHFEFTSGANPYIAKTEDEVERIKRSRGDSAHYVGSINGIDYYKVDDSEEDLFSVDEAFKPTDSGVQSVKGIMQEDTSYEWKPNTSFKHIKDIYNKVKANDYKYVNNEQVEFMKAVHKAHDKGYKPEECRQIKDWWMDIRKHNNKNEGYELSPRIDYNPNHLRDDEGKIMADRWYASKWPDDEVGIEQLQGITLDDALKDRKILGHCDTQVRERVYAQLDKYIPLSKESPMYKEKNESKSISESSYKKGDRVELDNGMTGTVTKDFDWENEDQVSVEIDGTKEMRYPRSETLKDLRESYQDYRFDVSCNDGPTKTVSLVWKENDIEGAKEMAKKYYAQEHTTYADDRENKWTIEESLTEDKAVSSSIEFDDDTDDMSFYYEDEQWEEPGVSPRKDFYEDGKEFTWVKRHGDVEHLDFDNWAVWEAYCHDDAESYYFIVDEDTEFIDWGPIDTLEEAQEFLQSKVSDWENDYDFVDNFADDDLDEGIFDKIKGYGKDLVKGIAGQVKDVAQSIQKGRDEKTLKGDVSKDMFSLAQDAGAEVTTTSDKKNTVIETDKMNDKDKKALISLMKEQGIEYDDNLAKKGILQVKTSDLRTLQKAKDKKAKQQNQAQLQLAATLKKAGITSLDQLKQLDILKESFGDENAYDVSVYLFPPLTDEDLDMLRAYNLTYLGRNYGPYGDEDNYVVAGNESSLRNYANKYLGYELHPGYLYDYDDFAGEIEVNENLLSEGLQEEPHTIEAGPAVGMSQLLSDLIKDEYEAIDGYNSVIATADAEGYDDMIDVLTDVQAEENVHIGQLQELRKMVDPNAHMVEDGEEEAEEELSNPIM